MSASPSTERAFRAECVRCRRPAALCLCDLIPRITSRTGFTVVQHPRERRHPVGTARFVELGLGARVICPVHADRSLACAPELPEGTAVLFPGEAAREISELDPSERPTHVLVLDGTWHHVRRLWDANPWIAALPQVRLAPSAPSRYRIRREPKRHYLSTVEAVVEALRALEPDLEGLERLLAAFDRMVELQLGCATGEARAPRTRARERRAVRRLPRALHEGFGELVVVYAEWAEPPRARPEADRTSLQWAAVRPATGECFERRIATADAHAADRAQHLGITGAERDEAEALDELRAFMGDRATATAWDRAPLFRLASSIDPGRLLALRDVYRTIRRRTGGDLEAVLEREGVASRRLPISGRAGERLGNAVAMIELLREQTARRRVEAAL